VTATARLPGSSRVPGGSWGFRKEKFKKTIKGGAIMGEQFTFKSEERIRWNLEWIYDGWRENFPSIPFRKDFIDFEEIYYSDKLLKLEAVAEALNYPYEVPWIKKKEDRERFLNWVLKTYGQKAYDYLNAYLEDFRR
jgi:hypothetical protein